MKLTVHNLEEMQKVARNFVSTFVPNPTSATVVGLYGDLGAGKTTFTQGVAQALGIADRVVSPTFVIEKIYGIVGSSRLFGDSSDEASQKLVARWEKFIHIDAYRLEKSDELLHLGWQDIVSDPANLIFIEWPERVADIMPPHIKILLKTLENENEREIEILE